MSAPDLTQKVLGFRGFGLEDGGLVATGVGSMHWLPGPNKARCLARYLYDISPRFPYPSNPLWVGPEPGLRPNRHPAPASGCNCGLYGMHKPPEGWLDGILLRASPARVAAAVLGWGRMEVHRSGFRAEYAEVVLLGYDPLTGLKAIKRVQRIAKRYGVRAVDIENIDAEAHKLGRIVPEVLLPDPEPPMTLAPPKMPAVTAASYHLEVALREMRAKEECAKEQQVSRGAQKDEPSPRRRLLPWGRR